MDTEKYLEIQQKMIEGKSPNDEGPYYHHSWWESYKSSIKGKFGGAVIGSIIGAVVGGVVAGATAVVTGTLAPALFLGTIGAFAGGGLLYAVHEFSDIGKVTGAVSAAQEQAEIRMRLFEEGKFAELKEDINQLRGMVGGKPDPAITAQAKEAREAMEAGEDYRTTHYAKIDTPTKNKLVFWKVALIGLVVGAIAGALLAASPVGAHLLEGLIGGSPLGHALASMFTLGAIGASFGINRDIFRKIFDKTDLWFKGITHAVQHQRVQEHQVAAGQDVLEETGLKTKEKPVVPAAEANVATTVAYEGPGIDYPTSNTYHRDRVLAAAEKALLSFDHTRATPQ